MRYSFSFRTMAAAVILAAAGYVAAAERIDLAPSFLIQPATDTKKMPDPAEWSRNTGTTIGEVEAPDGASWKNIDRGKINSQYLKCSLEVPVQWDAGRILLDFERINGNAIIFLNGRKVGERLGPYGDIDITGFAVPGRSNELVIFNTRDYTDVSRTLETDLLRYISRGPKSPVPVSSRPFGINAPLHLIHHPAPAALASVWTETGFRNKTITLRSELDVQQAIKDAELKVKIIDAEGRTALEFSRRGITLEPGTTEIDVSAKWENPILWELDGGYLYTAKVALCDASGKVIDRESFPFGFREIWVDGKNLMVNGHKARFRVEWSSFGINENSMTLLRLLGRNMIYYQANPSGWWRDWYGHEVYVIPKKELDLCDANGIAVLLPIPTIHSGGAQLLKDPQLQKQYREEMEGFMKRYRQHPSVFAWCMSMNTLNPRDSILPNTIGVRSRYDHPQARALEYIATLVKAFDPTRLAYSHADGNLADLASGNCYPNFAPVQEVEDWAEPWSKHGNMPWWACEYAAVYDGSYFKGRQFLLTEYAAIMLGPKAYRLETDKQLENTIKLGIENTGHGSDLRYALKYAPLYYEVQKRYVKGTDRAWRTYGILGWHYFNAHIGYGNPPEAPDADSIMRYSAMTKPVTARPDWVNDQFDYHAKDMQSLLAYIAGAPDHTDKSHSFYAGEAVTKQLAMVWDGPGDLKLSGKWVLTDAQGKDVLNGTFREIELRNGDIRFEPIRFTAPEVSQRTEFQLKLVLHGYRDKPVIDTFALEVFPKRKPIDTARVYRLYDPQEKSGWVKELLPSVKPLAAGEKPALSEIVIFGRESLKIEDELPFSAEDVRNGLHVIFLEQRPEVWEAMGFRNYDASSRDVFPVLKRPELREADLRNWRGKATLLPEFRAARAFDVQVAPKTSNRGIVASTAMEIPQTVGFQPILACEFDMNYSPLLAYRDGKGEILYCSLDFTGRAGVDPAATELAAFLLENVGMFQPFREPLKVYFNLAAEELEKRGIRTEPAEIRRAFVSDDGLGRFLPPNLLRYRDKLAINRIVSGKPGDRIERGGAFLFREGRPAELYCQVVPGQLEGRYADDPDRKEAVAISVVRLKQLEAQLKTAAGETPSPETMERLTRVRRGAAYRDLDGWTVLGPFSPGTSDGSVALAEDYPGQESAIEGDTNPNLTFRTADGRTLDFRTTVSADPDGFIDLGRALKPAGADAVAFAIKEIDSPAARRAVLRLGADYLFHLYVNGKLVHDQSTGIGGPAPNAYKVRIRLKEGKNVITLKVMSGSKGFGFWANLSEPGSDENSGSETANKELLYDPTIKIRSPYEYYFW